MDIKETLYCYVYNYYVMEDKPNDALWENEFEGDYGFKERFPYFRKKLLTQQKTAEAYWERCKEECFELMTSYVSEELGYTEKSLRAKRDVKGDTIMEYVVNTIVENILRQTTGIKLI